MKKRNGFWFWFWSMAACFLFGCGKSGSCEELGPTQHDSACYCDRISGYNLPLNASTSNAWAWVEARLVSIGEPFNPYSEVAIPEGSCAPVIDSHWMLDVMRLRQNNRSEPSLGQLDVQVETSILCPETGGWNDQIAWWSQMQQSGVTFDLFMEKNGEQWRAMYIILPDGMNTPSRFTTGGCPESTDDLLPTTSAILEAGLNSALSAPADAEGKELTERCLEAVQEAGATVYVQPDC